MKSFRRFCLVVTLIFTFSFSAYAGEIECPGITQPTTQATVAGETPNNITLTQTALSLIVSVLSLS